MPVVNGDNRQKTSPAMTSSSEPRQPIIDNIIPDWPDESSHSQRTVIVTAAAGALTAAVILAGWGLHLEQNEAGLLRAGLSAQTSRREPNFSYFHEPTSPILNSKLNSPQQITEQQWGGSQKLNHADDMANLKRLNNINNRSRKYAAKRAQLKRIMAQLRSFYKSRSNNNIVPQSGSTVAANRIAQDAQYRSLLRQAEELRNTLETIHNNVQTQLTITNQLSSGKPTVVINQTLSSHTTSAVASNRENVPISATPMPIPQSEQPSRFPRMANNAMKRAQYHTLRLMIRLEQNRLDVTTRLAAVELQNNQPVR